MTYEPTNGLDRKYSRQAINTFNAIIRSGYFNECNGNWEVFCKTFGWFKVSQGLTGEQKYDVELMWRDKFKERFE